MSQLAARHSEGVTYYPKEGIICLKDGSIIHRSRIEDKFLEKHPYDISVLRSALERLNYIDSTDLMGIYLSGG